MVKYYCHKLGKRWVLGLEGNDKVEIEQHYWSFENRGTNDSELKWMSDSFAYFTTTPEKVLHTFKQAELTKLENKQKYRDLGKSYVELANKRAQKRFSEIQSETFYQFSPNINSYQLGKADDWNEEDFAYSSVAYNSVNLIEEKLFEIATGEEITQEFYY
jgi:hypothetical protein